MLSPSEQRFLHIYKKQLASKRKFILAHGITFGILMLMTQSAYRYFIRKELFTFQNLLLEMVVWLAGGLLYGMVMYWFLNRRLQKIEKKRSAR